MTAILVLILLSILTILSMVSTILIYTISLVKRQNRIKRGIALHRRSLYRIQDAIRQFQVRI